MKTGMNGISVYCRSDFLPWGGLKSYILFTLLMFLICVPNLVHRPVLNFFALILACDAKRINRKAPVMSYTLLLHSGS
jgi:hypothetical protein